MISKGYPVVKYKIVYTMKLIYTFPVEEVINRAFPITPAILHWSHSFAIHRGSPWVSMAVPKNWAIHFVEVQLSTSNWRIAPVWLAFAVR